MHAADSEHEERMAHQADAECPAEKQGAADMAAASKGENPDSDADADDEDRENGIAHADASAPNGEAIPLLCLCEIDGIDINGNLLCFCQH